MKPLALSLFVCACACAGPQGPILLTEGYCTAGQADRCYYEKPPADGF